MLSKYLFVPTALWCSQPWSQKFLFTVDSNQWNDSKLVKALKISDCRIPALSGTSTSISPRLRGHLQGWSRKIARARVPRYLLWDCVFYIGQGNCTQEVSTAWLPKRELSKDSNNWHANMIRDKAMRPPPYTENYRQVKRSGSRELVFLREGHIRRLCSAKWSEEAFNLLFVSLFLISSFWFLVSRWSC